MSTNSQTNSFQSASGTPQRGSAWGLKLRQSKIKSIDFSPIPKPIVMQTQTHYAVFNDRTEDGIILPTNFEKQRERPTDAQKLPAEPPKKKGWKTSWISKNQTKGRVCRFRHSTTERVGFWPQDTSNS